uniref:RING-CH-type domain-containing protein n=1 Tax=Steinernema glaseri TaxID=37863 RepID=A0A1I7Y2G5_9BILA
MTAKAMAKNAGKEIESIEFTSCFCGLGAKARIPKTSEYDCEDEVPTCRICLSSSGTLVQPCACSGSIGHVHRECLGSWIKVDRKAKAREECELCKTKFAVEGMMCLAVTKWSPPQMTCKVLMVVCGILGITFSLLYIALLLDDRSFFERVLRQKRRPEVEDVAYLLLAGLLVVGMILLGCIGVHGMLVYFAKQRIPKFVKHSVHVV